jgi:hypothetical protein
MIECGQKWRMKKNHLSSGSKIEIRRIDGDRITVKDAWFHNRRMKYSRLYILNWFEPCDIRLLAKFDKERASGATYS